MTFRDAGEIRRHLFAATLKRNELASSLTIALDDLERNRPADPWNVGEPTRTLLLDTAEELERVEHEIRQLEADLERVEASA